MSSKSSKGERRDGKGKTQNFFSIDVIKETPELDQNDAAS
jgi:hypothetical protein